MKGIENILFFLALLMPCVVGAQDGGSNDKIRQKSYESKLTKRDPKNDGIILKYSLTNEEKEHAWFSEKCFKDKDYTRIIYYDTICSNSDTLFIILPDERVISEHRGMRVIDLKGVCICKRNFIQYLSYKAEKKIVVLKSDGEVIEFENKKGYMYKLKKVYSVDDPTYIYREHKTRHN